MSKAEDDDYTVVAREHSDGGIATLDFRPLARALEEYLAAHVIEPAPQKLFSQLRSLNKEAQQQVIRRAKQLEPIMDAARKMRDLSPEDRAEALRMLERP